jgi:hypothetical protein
MQWSTVCSTTLPSVGMQSSARDTILTSMTNRNYRHVGQYPGLEKETGENSTAEYHLPNNTGSPTSTGIVSGELRPTGPSSREFLNSAGHSGSGAYTVEMLVKHLEPIREIVVPSCSMSSWERGVGSDPPFFSPFFKDRFTFPSRYNRFEMKSSVVDRNQ